MVGMLAQMPAADNSSVQHMPARHGAAVDDVARTLPYIDKVRSLCIPHDHRGPPGAMCDLACGHLELNCVGTTWRWVVVGVLECREAAVLTAGEGDVTAQRLISSPQLMLAYSYARKLTERSRSYRTSHRGWVPEHARSGCQRGLHRGTRRPRVWRSPSKLAQTRPRGA